MILITIIALLINTTIQAPIIPCKGYGTVCDFCPGNELWRYYQGYDCQMVSSNVQFSEFCDDRTYSYRTCDPRFSCIERRCSCPSGYKYSVGDCYPVVKLNHLEKCNLTILNECINPENECIPDVSGKHRCLCDASTYRRSGVCHPLSELRITNFQVERNDTTQVRFTWVLNAYGLQVNYTIEWTPGKGTPHKEEKIAGKDGVMVSDLTPGRQYTFLITSRLPGDAYYYTEKMTSVKRTVDMLPAQPGPIVQNTSQLDSPPYNLTFQPSDGDVAKYKITLTAVENSTFREVIEVVEPRVENLNLLPGRVYTYTIIAFNIRGEITQPVIGTFRTGSIMEGNDDDEDNINVPVVVGAGVTSLALVAIAIVIIVIVMLKRRKADNKSSKQDVEPPQRDSNNIYMSYASNGYIEPNNQQNERNVYNEASEEVYINYVSSHSDEEDITECDKDSKKLEHSYENVHAECPC